MARTKKRLGKGGDAVDTVSAPELFRSGLMAAARFDISEVEPDFHALAAELMAFGLDHLAPALAELGVEKLADLEFLQECDLQGAGLRVVPRRKLRRALLLSARDAGGEGYAADRTLPFGQPEPGPEPSLSLLSEADDAGVAGGSSDARDPGLAQNVTEMLLCMTGVLQQIVRTLKDSDDLLEEVCGGLRVGIVAIREQLMAVEDFVQAASLVERGAASVADAVAEGLLEQNPASAVARAALYATAPGPHEGIADAKAGARWADAADPTCGAPDKDDLDAFELPRPPKSFVDYLPKVKDKAPPAEEVGLDEPVTSDELLSAVCWDPVLEVSAALSSTVAPTMDYPQSTRRLCVSVILSQSNSSRCSGSTIAKQIRLRPAGRGFSRCFAKMRHIWSGGFPNAMRFCVSVILLLRNSWRCSGSLRLASAKRIQLRPAGRRLSRCLVRSRHIWSDGFPNMRHLYVSVILSQSNSSRCSGSWRLASAKQI